MNRSKNCTLYNSSPRASITSVYNATNRDNTTGPLRPTTTMGGGGNNTSSVGSSRPIGGGNAAIDGNATRRPSSSPNTPPSSPFNRQCSRRQFRNCDLLLALLTIIACISSFAQIFLHSHKLPSYNGSTSDNQHPHHKNVLKESLDNFEREKDGRKDAAKKIIVSDEAAKEDSAPDESLEENNQRVVLLAGPHKTATSSIQLNMLRWLNDENHASGLGKDWAWPSPIATFLEDGCIVQNGIENYQVFYWWIQAMMGSEMGSENIQCTSGNEKIYSRMEMTDKYTRAFFDHWQKGSNLVIASEAMDFVTSENPLLGPNVLLENIISSLPWHANYPPAKASGSDDDITVVVSYRSPRSRHLISLWHQCCMEKMSFHEWLSNMWGQKAWIRRKDPLNSLDSLKIAKVFLDRGLKVVLIDMAGVEEKGYDMSNVIACDVLNANCSPEKRFVGDPEEEQAIVNVKSHNETNFNVTRKQLERIEEVIQYYDCNYLSLLEEGNLTVLYSHSIKQTFNFCQEHAGDDRARNRKDMAKQIADIVNERRQG